MATIYFFPFFSNSKSIPGEKDLIPPYALEQIRMASS
jgi:hypothetical protein